MIKKLQALKAKRGFTLVELIVVVGIIAVLSAILVPMLFGMVSKARVSSANSTASSINKAVTTFLVLADGNSCGMVSNNDATDVLNITVNNFVWECSSANPSHFNSGSTGVTWGQGGAASRFSPSDNVSAVTSGEKTLNMWLAQNLADVKQASIVIVLKGGKCTFVAYCPSLGSALPTNEYPTITNGRPDQSFEWNGSSAGISPNGYIIGTYPQIPLTDD